jgi:transcriptional regulator of acetoin/glycerol metabolism
VQRSGSSPSLAQPGEQTVNIRGRREAVERDAILDAIRDTNGDKGAAAQLLGMARSTFYRRLKELGL